jgi:hypothetical protein
MIKPAELIDISGASHLSLLSRRVYNQLLANAFGLDMATYGHEWSIALSELRGAHHGNEHVAEAIEALMRTIVTVRLSNGRTRRVQLLGGNDMNDTDRQHGKLTYSFDHRLVDLLRKSTIFGKLEIAVMMAFSSKYALALYEAIARRVRLQHKFSEEFTLEEFRDLIGVEDGKLEKFSNLNLKAIKPAVAEINAMASFGIEISPLKEGRKVVRIYIGWWQKDVDDLKIAFAEVRRTRVGRKARINDRVEETVQMDLPTLGV